MRTIPTKNYFLVLGVSVLIIILTLYLRAFYLSYKAYNGDVSYFTFKKVSQITKDDFDFILTESTNNILYVGYNSSKLYSIEKKLYREFEKNDLLDRVIYWNVDDYLENNDYIQILKNKFPDVDIYSAPAIIVIVNGEAKESIKIDEDSIKDKKIKKIVERNQLN